MRKVTFGGACSLDGYFARPDHAVDWIMWSDETAGLMKDYWANIDTIVMGRKTWEVAMVSVPRTKGKKPKNPFAPMDTYVFSRTLEPGVRDGVTFLSDDPGKFILDLKKKEGKEICIMGGGGLAQTLLEAGAIDEIGLNIHPVLLGSGIPAFYDLNRQIDLELTECRPFKNGCVYVSYRVQHPKKGRGRSASRKPSK